MNDFLQSIRNGNFSKDGGNGNKNRYSQRPRRHYESNGNNSRYGNDKKQFRPRHNHNEPAISEETLIAIKDSLESIAANQEAGLIFAERRAIAEERKADAFEFIAANIGNISLGKQEDSMTEIQEDAEVSVIQETVSTEVQPTAASDDSAPVLSKDETLKLIFKMRDDGSTYNEIASHLVSLNLPTFSGRGKWHAQTIHRLCQTP